MNNMLIQGQWPQFLPKLGLTYFLALRKFWMISFLIASIFVSAVAVVYIEAMNRMLYIDLQSLQKDRDSLTLQWGQLLLEQSTWATQARIQSIAENKLNMSMPDQSTIVMVKE